MRRSLFADLRVGRHLFWMLVTAEVVHHTRHNDAKQAERGSLRRSRLLDEDYREAASYDDELQDEP